MDEKEVRNQIRKLKYRIKTIKRLSTQKKICAICGKEFIPEKSMHEKFCSEECRKASDRAWRRKWAKKHYEEMQKAKQIKKEVIKGEQELLETSKPSYEWLEERCNSLTKMYNDEKNRSELYARMYDNLYIEHVELKKKVDEYNKISFWKKLSHLLKLKIF